MGIKYGNVQKVLGTGLTFHACSTSCVHEKEVNDEEDDEDDGDTGADDGERISHTGEKAHCRAGNSHVT